MSYHYSRKYRAVWERANGPVPEGHVVHHVNGDKDDHRLENLQLMTVAEHSVLHASDTRPKRLKNLNRTIDGRRMREYRKRLGIGQAELAEELGKGHASHVFRMEMRCLEETEFVAVVDAMHRVHRRRMDSYDAVLSEQAAIERITERRAKGETPVDTALKVASA